MIAVNNSYHKKYNSQFINNAKAIVLNIKKWRFLLCAVLQQTWYYYAYFSVRSFESSVGDSIEHQN